MKRDAAKAELLPDPKRIAAGLPIGFEGAYFVGGTGSYGQGDDPSIVNGNEPPGVPKFPDAGSLTDFNERYSKHLIEKKKAVSMGAQPGLWCQWVPNESGTAIVWDEGEKFYEYVEWIRYLIEHFLQPWGYIVNGNVEWSGEQTDDRGVIRITDNLVEVGFAQINYQF